MTEPSHFPYRLFRWFLSRQILLALGLLLIFNCAFLLWVINRTDPSSESFRWALHVLLVSGLGSVLILVAVSFFIARRLVDPLGRLIFKTRRLREFPFEAEELDEVEMAYDEPGEWYDLERALNQLGQTLRQKTIRLSREKTELRAIMAAVSEAVLAVDNEQKVLFFNSQFAMMFQPVQGASDVKLSEISRSPEIVSAYRDCFVTGQPIRRELSIQFPGDTLPREYELSVAPLRKKHNQEIYGSVGVFYEITELKRAERIRIEFVGNVSHELRTPLTTIQGYLQTLKQDFAKKRYEQSEEFLDIANKNVERLKSLVEDLLDLSSLEAGQRLDFDWLRTREITEAVISQVNARDHRIDLQFEADEVFADEKRAEQVLRNLLENAVRYVPKGKEIRILWSRAPAGIKLSVRDNGPGIAPEHQARLFERFYRVDESRARSDGGTGIGLSLVKHIMQRHGGTVSVQSQPGVGAEFVCYFPDGERRSR